MKIDFNKNSSELFEVGNESNNVTIDDTVNIDAVEEMISMYNSDYSLHRIKSNLEGDDRLTGDEVDHLMEAINVLEEMESSPKEDNAPWTEEEVIGNKQTAKEIKEMIEDTLNPHTTEEAEQTKSAIEKLAPWKDDRTIGEKAHDKLVGDYISGVDPIRVDESGSGTIYINKNETEMVDHGMTDKENAELQMVKQPEIEGKKPRKQRETKTATTTTGNKSISPQDYIKMLEEKIELTKLLSNITAPEIPDELTKAGRELLIRFCQDHNKLIVDYIESIQTL